MYRTLLFSSVAAVAALWLAVAAATSDRQAALRGVDYIRTTQQPDGGFGGFGIGQSFDAIFAIRSAGIDPNTVTTDGNSPADFLRANLEEAASSPGLAAKAALAAVSMDLDPTDVDGVNLLSAIESFHDAESGAYASDSFSNSLAVLGLTCAGNAVPDGAVDHLRATQLEDGGWGFDDFGDVDTTALAVQALLAAGVSPGDEAVQEAVAFFRTSQAADAGWGFDPAESNANSTAVVIQALLAADEDIEGTEYQVGGVTPLAFLLSLQQEDGSFPGFDPALATNQAVPALAGRTFCQAPVTTIEDLPEPTPTATPTVETPAPTQPADTPTPTLAAPGPPATGTGQATGGFEPAVLGFAAVVLMGAFAFIVARRRAP